MWYIILGIILFILVLFLFCALKLSSKYDNDDKKVTIQTMARKSKE